MNNRERLIAECKNAGITGYSRLSNGDIENLLKMPAWYSGRKERDERMTTTKAKMTPGPWSDEEGTIVAADGSHVASVAGANCDDEEGMANARAIALLPELVECLERIEAIADANDDYPRAIISSIYNEAHLMIRRVKGEAD